MYYEKEGEVLQGGMLHKQHFLSKVDYIKKVKSNVKVSQNYRMYVINISDLHFLKKKCQTDIETTYKL